MNTRIEYAPTVALSMLLVDASLSLACGDSPTAPTGPPRGDALLLGSFRVDVVGNFAGLGPHYTVCGTIGVAPAVTEEIVVYGMTVSIRDAGGREILKWEDPSVTRLPPGGGLGGCFGQHSDPDPTRAPGASFLVRVTYSRVNGRSEVVEASGAVVAPRPLL
jgi:hypothetical protein